MNRLLLTLTLGIASCGIGWGQEKPLPECTSKLVDGVWMIADIPTKGCVIRSECDGDGCHHKNPQSPWSPPDPEPLCPHGGPYCKLSKPEPVDVPAIRVGKECPDDGVVTGGGDRMCDYKTGKWVSCLGQSYNDNLAACENYNGKAWSCADKSRILLIAEDEKRWCHKPQTGDHQ